MGFTDDPTRQCDGKRTYSSKSEAKRAFGRLRTVGVGDGNMKPYRCPHCGSFHLGHRYAGAFKKFDADIPLDD